MERLFDACVAAGATEAAIGVALDARRADRLQHAVRSSSDTAAALAYAQTAALAHCGAPGYRAAVLRLVVSLHEEAVSPDWSAVARCQLALDDAAGAASVLARLLKGGEDDALLALQIGFDLVAAEARPFVARVAAALAEAFPPPPPAPTPAPATAGDAAPGAPVKQAAEVGDGAAAAPPAPLASADRAATLARVLSGDATASLALDFLHARCAADAGLLTCARAACEPRNSVCHGAVVFANAVMHAGTTVDSFLRSNLDWLARATNWAKFSATAGLGVVHRGHLGAGRGLMAPYLPRGGAGGAGGGGGGGGGAAASPYSEGGALFALGLLSAGHASPDAPFLLESLRGAVAEPVQHGAALGLGAALLGSRDAAATDALRAVLFTDGAVPGEGAALGTGLLHAGAGPDAAAELVAYARDTAHEKIVRTCGVGAALTVLGRETDADGLIDSLSTDADPLLRYGGAFAIGLAYAGTGNAGAVARLLAAAVGDVSDDVRRGAVASIGFVLAASPDPGALPATVALLAQSFNPHVRYGAALAVGIGCAATGGRAAVDLLAPLLGDPVNFVRQGALIASALVLMQQPTAVAAPLRAALARASTDRHEEVMCRMGAIMATGILDAGGRSAVVCVRAPGGHLRHTTLVGLALFAQHWWWYPLSYFLGVALTPAGMIGVDATLRAPAFSALCECRPSLFAHPPPAASGPTTVTTARAPAAVLSTTVRAAELAKKREDAKKGKEGGGGGVAAMDADAKPAAGDVKPEGEGGKDGGDAAAKKEEEEEAGSYPLPNPARVAPAQALFVRFDRASRWAPVRPRPPLPGVVVLRDRSPGEPVEYAAVGKATTAAAAAAAARAGAAGAAPAADEPAPPPALDLASA